MNDSTPLPVIDPSRLTDRAYRAEIAAPTRDLLARLGLPKETRGPLTVMDCVRALLPFLLALEAEGLKEIQQAVIPEAEQIASLQAGGPSAWCGQSASDLFVRVIDRWVGRPRLRLAT